MFCTVQLATKLWFLDIVAPSLGVWSTSLQAKPLAEESAVAVFVGEDSMNRNVGVGDGVTVGVLVGVSVGAGVSVGGIAAAVCEAAACAVPAMIVLIAPGGATEGTPGGTSVDRSQLISTAHVRASARDQCRMARGLWFVGHSPLKDWCAEFYGSGYRMTSMEVCGKHRPPSTFQTIP